MPFSDDDLRECIDLSREVIEKSNVCLSEHVGDAEMVDCLLFCMDANDIASACTQMMQRQFGSQRTPCDTCIEKICEACAQICGRCADECEKFDSPECRDCADACRRCAEACEAMAA